MDNSIDSFFSERKNVRLIGFISIGEGNECKRGHWIVRFHIGYRGERNIVYKGVETARFSNIDFRFQEFS